MSLSQNVYSLHISADSQKFWDICHGMLCNLVLQGCMQLPMLPPLIVSGFAACMLACEVVIDEHYHMQSLQYRFFVLFTLIWWGSALPV